MRNNIPPELRALNQWVVANDDKIPYDPKTKRTASVTDPATWGSYDEACHSGFKHVGFVLAAWGHYTIIDLDNKPDKPLDAEGHQLHEAILGHFQSYTERSMSGRGYHVIVKGKLPSGVHRDSVEMYSSGRYMICTGDVVKQLPITDYQPSLDNMYAQMKPADESVSLTDRESLLNDAELVDMAMGAVNGDKFNSLCSGEISEYPSQSEADLALLSIIAFYSPDNDQVRRIFRMSALGQREKAQKNDTYLNFALGKIRAKQPAPIDFGNLLDNAAAAMQSAAPIVVPEQAPPTQHKPMAALPALTAPPGLVGDLATYIYNSSVRPVPEIALAASLAFFSGICGRQYNTYTKTGLNQYIILLAGTGRGKEGVRAGIDRIFDVLRMRIPGMEGFRGPSAFSSGPAVVKTLASNPCQLSVLGEFGMTLQRISDAKSSGPDRTFMQALLDLYNQSGFDRRLGISKYSNKENDTTAVQAPSLTILGESTPETFLAGLDEGMIQAGLIPRFLLIEYTGERPYLNSNAGYAPPQELVDRIAAVAETVVRMQANQTCCIVPLDAAAQKLDYDFERWTTDEINRSTGSSAVAELWNRAHLKALKLASILAIGINPNSPLVTAELFQWAKDFAVRDVKLLADRFTTGDVGTGDSKQLMEMKKLVVKYLELTPDSVTKLGGAASKMWVDKVIPMRYFLQRTANLASFKTDRSGATNALKRTLTSMTDSGLLVEVGRLELQKKYAITSVAYGVGNEWK